MKTIPLNDLENYVNLTLDYQSTWHWLMKYMESNRHWWQSESGEREQIERIANSIPPEWRWASSDSYRLDKEVGFDQREGPEYEFDKFLEEVLPEWNLSGIASFDLSVKKEAWKEFALKHPIPYWSLSRWRYASADPSDYLSKSFFQNIQGLGISQIDPKDRNLLSRFQDQDSWKHWDYLGWDWLWGDNPDHLTAWIDILEESNVKKFSFKSSRPGVIGMKKLGQLRKFWNRLESLTLHGIMLGDVEMDSILNENPSIQNLKSISLDDSPMSNGGKESLQPNQFLDMARAGWFQNLERLYLYYHRLGMEGLRALGESGAVQSLRYLRLGVGNMKDDDLLLLAEFPWEKLNYISLSFNYGITRDGLEAFRKTKLYDNCHYVYIEHKDGNSLSKGSLVP
jgi:hypothetical protein